MSVLLPGGLTPPRLHLHEATRAWAALVLAVSSYTRVSHIDLLRRQGRSYMALANARKLLVWAFIEVADTPETVSMAWLEQCMALGRRSIRDILRDERPEGLEAVLTLYAELTNRLGSDEIIEAVTAGMLGERSPKARLWPKGFMRGLGLSEE